MSSVCFYFQVHQPFRLRKCNYQDFKSNHLYFDEQANGAIMRKVAEKCYLPMNRLLKELIEKHQGRFKVSFSITGVAVEQMQLYAPEVLDSFIELAETGCVEFIGETYYHSLSALFDRDEFLDQVQMHREMVSSVFGQEPKVFRNTELIYDDRVGALAAEAGFHGIIAEGVDDVLGWRSPNYLYSVQGKSDCRLLLKNYQLSDDIAFRFSNRGWKEFPLTADKFSRWVHAVSGSGDMINLFMDYETFGEHQWEATGIFEFMRYLPEMILQHPDWDFATPSEVIERYPSRSEIHFHRTTSWADIERDLTAWYGNRMQKSAFEQIYALGKYIRTMGDPTMLGIWRKLLTSDHYYYMCTKWFADGDVHAYFSPYESPYEAFVTFMNAFKDFKEFVTEQALSRALYIPENVTSDSTEV